MTLSFFFSTYMTPDTTTLAWYAHIRMQQLRNICNLRNQMLSPAVAAAAGTAATAALVIVLSIPRGSTSLISPTSTFPIF